MIRTKMATKTQDQWLAFLHQLHCKVRGAKGVKLTGMPALIEISNFIMFRFMDNSDKLGIKLEESDEINIKKYKMKDLYELYATSEKINDDKKTKIIKDKNAYKLWEAIYDVKSNDGNCLIVEYYNNDYLKCFLDSTTSKVSAYMSKNTAAEDIQQIIHIIYKEFEGIEFNSKFFDMFGSAYEKFKTDANGNAGKQTAQHFTNVFIKQIIITELNPVHSDIFYEPCAGTGGFIHTADNYVCKQEGEEKALIFKSNIYANECNPEIFRPLMMNMLFHNIPVTNISEQDSLCTENIKNMLGKADIIASNFPFGMSTVLTQDGNFDDWTKYWEVLQSGKGYIKNSSAQFMIHMCHSLKPNGRLGVVSDRGILNNGTDKATSSETKVRKHLFEKYNLYKIILLPENSFTYTKFQTCIIFIRKGETTKVCEIYEAHFRKPKEFRTSEMYVDEMPLYTYNIDDLRKNNYSIKPKVIDAVSVGDYVKLGDVCKFIKGKSMTTAHMIDGDYKVIGGGYVFMEGQTHSEYNCESGTVIMSNDGAYAGYINKYNEKIFITSHCNKMTIKQSMVDKYNYEYIYYYLKIVYQELLISSENNNGFQKGQAQPSINIDKMYEHIKIPSIPLSHQKEIVEVLDEQFKKYNIELLSPYTKTIKLFDLLVYRKYEEFKDAMHLIYRKIEADAMHQQFEMDKKAIFNILVNNVDNKLVSLGDVVEIDGCNGKFKLSELADDGIYNYYSASKTNPTGKINDYCFDGDNYLLFVKSGGNKNNLESDTGLGKVFKCSGKTAGNPAIIKLITKHNTTNIDYLILYLSYNVVSIRKYAVFNAGNGNIRIPEFMTDFKIKIPSIEDQQKIIQHIESMEATQKTYADYGLLLSQQLDNINNMIKNICVQSNEEQVIDIEEEEKKIDEPEKEAELTKPKRVVKKKKIIEDDTSIDETIKEKVIMKPKKVVKKKDIVDDKSIDETNIKPKKVVKNKDIAGDKSIDETDIKPKKVVKNKDIAGDKPIDETDIKPVKKIKKKKIINDNE
jgi:type I restriction-modification system DNA methylase subunit